MNKISEIKGKKIYSDSKHIGEAKDVVINTEEGKITYIIKGKISSMPKRNLEQAKKFVKENLIPFEKVKAVRDIIVVEGQK
ncbi:MAG: PRC-barrel domain-containing protein [archaeon]